jgi:hypothetical protein
MSNEDLTAEDIRRALEGEGVEGASEESVEESETYIPRPRRGRPPKRKKAVEIPADVEEALKKVDGATALKLMQFLHESYLSWITEAEAEKYYVTVSRAYTEALQQQQQTLRELTSAFAQQLQSTITPALESLSKSLEAISARVESLEKATRPTTIDDRLILLGAVLLRGFREKLGLPKDLDAVIDYIIYDTAKRFVAFKVEEEGGKEDKG